MCLFFRMHAGHPSNVFCSVDLGLDVKHQMFAVKGISHCNLYWTNPLLNTGPVSVDMQIKGRRSLDVSRF